LNNAIIRLVLIGACAGPATPAWAMVTKVFLLAGQSNMEGAGEVPELGLPYMRTSSSRRPSRAASRSWWQGSCAWRHTLGGRDVRGRMDRFMI
jgi:hypothetical protein